MKRAPDVVFMTSFLKHSSSFFFLTSLCSTELDSGRTSVPVTILPMLKDICLRDRNSSSIHWSRSCGSARLYISQLAPNIIFFLFIDILISQNILLSKIGNFTLSAALTGDFSSAPTRLWQQIEMVYEPKSMSWHHQLTQVSPLNIHNSQFCLVAVNKVSCFPESPLSLKVFNSRVVTRWGWATGTGEEDSRSHNASLIFRRLEVEGAQRDAAVGGGTRESLRDTFHLRCVWTVFPR